MDDRPLVPGGRRSDLTSPPPHDPRPLEKYADSVLRGFNGTIFAYGQTGAGKSHTMEGLADKPELRGIIPNSFKHIFDHINANTDPNKQFLVRASYLEIYNEEIRDLLGKDKTQRLELKENVEREVYVKDLMAVVVKSAAEMDTVLQNGKKNRVTGATLMNETSSRSHAVFLITLETAETGDDGKSHIRVGKLNLVDLAGCVVACSRGFGPTNYTARCIARGISN